MDNATKAVIQTRERPPQGVYSRVNIATSEVIGETKKKGVGFTQKPLRSLFFWDKKIFFKKCIANGILHPAGLLVHPWPTGQLLEQTAINTLE